MRYACLLGVVLVASVLTTACWAEDTKPATAPKTEKKAEAKMDKTLAKPKQDIQRFWVTPEMLMMWSKDGPVHDVYVLSTNFLGGEGFPLLDNPRAKRLFSNDDQDYGIQMGGRLTFGAWLDDARKWGFDLSGFALEKKEASWTYAADGSRYVAISFQPGSLLENCWNTAVFPGTNGAVCITSNSQLWGVEGSGLYNFKRSDSMSLDFSFGVKHLDLSEDFQVSNRFNFLPALGWYAAFEDKWETNNGFYGAKLGLKFNMTCWDRLLLNIEPAVSLGADCESLKISGRSHNPFGTPPDLPGGGFTGPANMGNYNKTEFAVAPEIKLGLGCRITRNISFNANYNFLYVSNVVRPGEQFSRRINRANVGYGGPGTPAVAPFDPQPQFENSDYWAHGVGVNLKIKF